MASPSAPERPAVVVLKAISWHVARKDLSLTRLPELPSAAASDKLRPLELGELVEDAAREPPFGRVTLAI